MNNLKKMCRISWVWALILISITPVFAGDLTDVSVLLDDPIAGHYSVYYLRFTTSLQGNGLDFGLPRDGRIQVTFPAGVNVNSLLFAASQNENMTGGFKLLSKVGQVVTFGRDSTGNAIGPGVRLFLGMAIVGNPAAVQNLTLGVVTLKANQMIIDQGVSSPVQIIAGDVARFALSYLGAQTAGLPFSVTITAQDAFNNQVTGFTGTVNLMDLTGRLNTPATGNFVNGQWTGSVSISRALINNRLTVTSVGKSGESNLFTVNPNNLNRLSFQTIISPQRADAAFPITIIARDAYENQVTSFAGRVNLSDLTGTINPARTDNFVNGAWTGSVQITRSQNDVTITATYAGVSETSNPFNVSPAGLRRFQLTNISTQAAGVYFPIIVTALDNFNNIVASFSGAVNLSDLTGTMAPNVSGNFTSGIWNGAVRINQTHANNVITVSNGSVTGNSNNFQVAASNVAQFQISNIGALQTAGVAFAVTITAKDAQHNTVTDFNGTANLSDLTGTTIPTVTENFRQGVWTGSVTITHSLTNNTLTVVSSGKLGTSNVFTVKSATLDLFTCESISSPQAAGENFQITITARDIFGNPVSDFSEIVNLSDDTGTLTPDRSGNFVAGVWSGNVRITKSQTDVRITARNANRRGQSNTFNINAGALSQFNIKPISTQAASAPFSITVTALDPYQNVVTNFTNTVDLSDLTGTLMPKVSENFTQGQWSGTVQINQARTGNVISVRRASGSENGRSNAFDVISSAIDHFQLSVIASPQIAGTAFPLMITAKDAANNTVSGFTGTANLRDLTGTISPFTTPNFVNGVWNGSVSITQSLAKNVITVTSSGKAGASNEFTVDAGALNQFTFQSISSPQIAGAAFSITITAEDVFGNRILNFNNPANLNDPSGTITPKNTPAFTAGQWTGAVTITQSRDDVQITATRNHISGQSNKFNVRSGTLASFSLKNIDSQIAGLPFPVTITARDNFGNTVTSFNGSVTLSDLTGTILPKISTEFTAGIWSGNVTISQTFAVNQLRVQRNGGSESGQSNNFAVIASTVDHFEISSISNPQTAGVRFPITITARDAQNNLVTTFNSRVNLTDLTGTVDLKTTGNFVNGQRTENILITRSVVNNTITVTAGGKAGVSNPFTVNPAVLDHFEFLSIASPQTAGTPFNITIQAHDLYHNLIINHSNPVSLSDNTGSISPTQSGPFSNGQWTGAVTIQTPLKDVKVNAASSGRSGSSNLFNVVAGTLSQFTLETISTQFAGEAFTITITARDANQNRIESFTGAVTLSDKTGTLTPTSSGNFINGQWIGNVTISQAVANNTITVQRSGGTERGVSNAFDILASGVDHFEITPITTPQVAGTSFKIRILARDAANNLVTGFNGQLKLSDLTGTLTPTLTGNFIQGAWQDTVSVRKSHSANVISVTNGNRAGNSNAFEVLPKPLHHLTFSRITSPQIAGFPFSVTISAMDQYENVVTAFNNRVSLTAPGAVLTPTNTANFINGKWTGEVMVPTREQDLVIRASFNTTSGQSNSFNVEPAGLHHLKLRDQAGGFGSEIGNVILTLDDKLRLYAAGYDRFENYIRDIRVNWRVMGNLQSPQPTFGTATIFDPSLPGQEGRIMGDTTGVIPDSTGLITVGSIAFVKIRTAAGGNGLELGDVTLSADDSLTLFAAGYDAGRNYLGEVSVFWQSTGNLEPVLADTSATQIFAPTRAPRLGTIKITHPTATGDLTGTLRVVPGRPTGQIGLRPAKSTLPADGVSTTTIRSTPIFDADANLVAATTLFSVRTTQGTIVSPPDASKEHDGWQVTPNDSGLIVFVLKASPGGGTAFITVNSTLGGSASGETVVNMTSLKVLSIFIERTTVSRGQIGIPVLLVVENIGSLGVSQITAGLKFTGPAPWLEDRRTDYPVVSRTDRISLIPGGSKQTLSFLVSVGANALNDTITIDGWVSGLAGANLVSDSSALQTDHWRVQTPAQLQVAKIEALTDTVSQGLDNVALTLWIKNTGEADANVLQASPKFWSIKENRELLNDYQIFSNPNNPQLVHGKTRIPLNFVINVGPTATLGSVRLNGTVQGSDLNSGLAIQDGDADTTAAWVVKSAALVGISSLKPSQSSVSRQQSRAWYVTMVVRNQAMTAVRLDQASLKFLIGGADVTPEYTLAIPSYFAGAGKAQLAGNQQDSLRFVVIQTGQTLGLITIEASIVLTDLQTGKAISQMQKTGVTVVQPGTVSILRLLPSQTRATINQSVPWRVAAVVWNEGGGAIKLSGHADSTRLIFEPANGFKFKSPSRLQRAGDLYLRGGAIDTLVFTVQKTGSRAGMAAITTQIRGTEMNSLQSVVAVNSEPLRVKLDNPARLQLVALESKALNRNQVNIGQNFSLQAQVQNAVRDAEDVREIEILLTSDGTSISNLRRSLARLPGDNIEPQSVTFDITASSVPNAAEIFRVQIVEGTSVNSGQVVPVTAALDSIENIALQTPARLAIPRVLAPASIRANQHPSWAIKVVVVDSGGAEIELQKPASQDVQIYVDGEIQKDYIVEPPRSLAGGGLTLTGNATDTLVYRVTTSGERSGAAQLQINLTGTDKNNGQEVKRQHQIALQIQTSARIALRETILRRCLVNPISKIGKVNHGQNFGITAIVRNLGQQALEQIQVRLRTNGPSKIQQPLAIIEYLPAEYGAIDSATFTVQADSVNWTEEFTTAVLQAYVEGTEIPATIETSMDSTDLVQTMR
ncbi:hypothetical protein L0128_09865, partial [candidate division KSB1 bacterium]|nr:hypothetical protein [candidate division KSB1 bacterium]